LNDWQSSNGGIWEKWYVNQGVFGSVSANAPSCTALAVEDQQNSQIEVYPNPVRQDMLIIRHSKEPISGIELASINGQILRTRQVEPAHTVYEDVSDLPPALYLLRVHITGGRILYRSVLIL
ncbi:MAG: T9SS C-terminal target domain-containing protein, partial [Bacteroidetes bacterium]